MPLGDGSPGVGQHVGPVAQLRPCAVEAHKDLADGIVLADLVIVQNSYNNLHFLQRGKERKKEGDKKECKLRLLMFASINSFLKNNAQFKTILKS